jgi:hypothetical protein
VLQFKTAFQLLGVAAHFRIRDEQPFNMDDPHITSSLAHLHDLSLAVTSLSHLVKAKEEAIGGLKLEIRRAKVALARVIGRGIEFQTPELWEGNDDVLVPARAPYKLHDVRGILSDIVLLDIYEATLNHYHKTTPASKRFAISLKLIPDDENRYHGEVNVTLPRTLAPIRSVGGISFLRE